MPRFSGYHITPRPVVEEILRLHIQEGYTYRQLAEKFHKPFTSTKNSVCCWNKAKSHSAPARISTQRQTSILPCKRKTISFGWKMNCCGIFTANSKRGEALRQILCDPSVPGEISCPGDVRVPRRLPQRLLPLCTAPG